MNITVNPVHMSVNVGVPSIDVTPGSPIVKEYEERPAYAGAYEVTPSNRRQTLYTDEKRMTGNVVINPIPSNYGLITWNGATLTVS